MSDHHKEHPDYAAMGIFAGYGECDPVPAIRGKFHFEKGEFGFSYVCDSDLDVIADAAEISIDEIEIRQRDSDEGRDYDEAWVGGKKIGEWR